MAKALSDGLAIQYDDLGTGEPALLCLPGWCAGRGAFTELARRLAERHRVLALDWRGHGDSDAAPGDFGAAELVRDALAVIAASGAQRIVPVTTAHAGWVAIELRRTLGHERVPKLVLLDWIVTPAPPQFLGGLAAMQDPANALAVRDQLFAMWTRGVEHRGVLDFVRDDMGSYSAEMWARGGREIAAAYARAGSPLAALASPTPPPPTLHLFAQGSVPAFVEAQAAFAADHAWFTPRAVDARSHFPTIEVPEQLVEPIEQFLD